MKIQLDTKNKTIKLEESVNLSELHELLEKILPNDQWKEYKLEPSIIQNWSSPIIVDRWIPRPYPWWDQPYYKTTNEFTISHQETGVYNLAIN